MSNGSSPFHEAPAPFQDCFGIAHQFVHVGGDGVYAKLVSVRNDIFLQNLS